MRRLAVALLVLVAACQGGVAATEADVQLTEFSITSTAETFGAGEVDLQVRNAGAFRHSLVVTDSDGQVVSAGDVMSPDSSSTLSLDLAPGEYQLTCRIIGQSDDGEVIDHYAEGMQAGITVRGS